MTARILLAALNNSESLTTIFDLSKLDIKLFNHFSRQIAQLFGNRIRAVIARPIQASAFINVSKQKANSAGRSPGNFRELSREIPNRDMLLPNERGDKPFCVAPI